MSPFEFSFVWCCSQFCLEQLSSQSSRLVFVLVFTFVVLLCFFIRHYRFSFVPQFIFLWLLSVYISDFWLPIIPSQFGAVIFVHPSSIKLFVASPGVTHLSPSFLLSEPCAVKFSRGLWLCQSLSFLVILVASILCNESFSLTQFCSFGPFLSYFSLSIWLSHCCTVNVFFLCLIRSCSINNFSCPFSVTLVASMCAVTCSYSLWFCQSLALILSAFFPRFCAVHLPVSLWFWQSFFLTCSQ